MKNIKITIAYKGTRYYGWQYQKNKTTVAGVIQRALSQVFDTQIKLTGASRTDRGVHAIGQVANFYLDCDKEINLKKLNALLPSDICIYNFEQVDESFHSRFSATKKEYRYFILNSPLPNVFLDDFTYNCNSKINFELFQWCLKQYEGEHDFVNFRKLGSGEKHTIRTVYSCDFSTTARLIIVKIIGRAFLRRMVRYMVGLALACASGFISKKKFLYYLDPTFRPIKRWLAPAKGLFLWKVYYSS